jgi:outer membrane murein-binding lipoprotein Lpp
MVVDGGDKYIRLTVGYFKAKTLAFSSAQPRMPLSELIVDVFHRRISAVGTGSFFSPNKQHKAKRRSKMKFMSYKKMLAVAAVASSTLLTGCVTNMFPGGPSPHGAIVTNVKSPAQNLTVATDANAGFDKTGSASSRAVMGLFAFGDSSVDAAMKKGGITKVHHVDHRVNSVLFGFWLQTTTIVHGE